MKKTSPKDANPREKRIREMIKQGVKNFADSSKEKSMNRLFVSKDIVIEQEQQLIRVKQRNLSLLILGAGGLLISGAFFLLLRSIDYWPSAFAGNTGVAFAMFLKWAAWLVLAATALVFLAWGVKWLGGGAVFDLSQGVLIRGRKQIAFGRIKDIRVIKSNLMGVETVSLAAEIDGQNTLLIPGQAAAQKERLESVAVLLRPLVLGEAPQALPDAATRTDAGAEFAKRTRKRFFTVFSLVLGPLWSVAGYVLMPDIIVTIPTGTHGVLLWPLGIWIAVLGVLELLRVPVYDWLDLVLRGTPGWKQIAFVLVWIGSYILFSYR